MNLSETETLKTSFAAKEKTWGNEKTLLTRRAETAETTLKEISTELNNLKGRVSQMVVAIFGKPSELILNIIFVKLEYDLPTDSVKNIYRSTKQISKPRPVD